MRVGNLRPRAERIFGLDIAPADDICVASIYWRDAAGGRLNRAVSVTLANSETEAGLEIAISRLHARRIAIAIAEASGMRLNRASPLKRLSRRLSRLLTEHALQIQPDKEEVSK